jgi:hypothetical protein
MGLKREDQKNIHLIEHSLSLLSINGGQYSYKQVAEITGISKSTLISANRG